MERLYNTDEVKNILHCSYKTVLNLIKQGKLKATKVGTEYRFKKEAVKNYIEENEVK